MFSGKIKIRVRYGEVDRMGYLHHGNYPLYFEEGRTELLRGLGLSYCQMEDDGILLPVREMNIKYFQPALYDNEVTVETSIPEMPAARLKFNYKLTNEKGELLCQAETILVFVGAKTRKPIRAPKFFIDLMLVHFSTGTAG